MDLFHFELADYKLMKNKSEKDEKIYKIKDNRDKYRSSSARPKKRTFKRVANLGLKVVIVTTLLTATKFTFKTDTVKTTEYASYIPEQKWQKYRKYDEKIVAGIALAEKFSNTPYLCGGGYWTIGYGNRKANGEEVNSNTYHINKTFGQDFLEQADPSKPYYKNYNEAMFLRAKEYVIAHLDEEIYPVIDEHVKVPLNEHEITAIAMFIYNIGSKSFINSEFLKGLNNGEKGLELAKKMTGFRAITKKNALGKYEKTLSKGLLKREWVMISMFLNPDIKTTDNKGKTVVRDFMSYLSQMRPGYFYKEKDMSFYYYEKIGSVGEDGYYTPKFDNETLVKFIKKNTHEKKNVGTILDRKTRESINKKTTYDLSVYFNKKNYNNM